MNFVILILTATFQIITCVEIISQKHAIQPIVAQYLGQDAYGHYSYGYITPTSTKSESKGTDGIIRGGYSYFDPKGKLQSVQYVADPVHGFLVAASNLPRDVPSVAYAKQKHLQKYESIKNEHAALALSKQIPQTDTVPVPLTSRAAVNLPIDSPAVAYAKQRHLEEYEAIKAQHASLDLSKHAALTISNPVHELPAVAHARAQHLAAFEAIKSRDLALRALNIANAKLVDSYTPIVSNYDTNYYSYGYLHPQDIAEVHNREQRGYSFMDTNGAIKTFQYLER